MSITQPPVGGGLTKELVLEAVAGVQEPAIGRGLVELKHDPRRRDRWLAHRS